MGALLLGFGLYLRRPLFDGNFGVVDAGRVYRSAQPGARLPGWLRQYKIATILNLRGGTISDDFYRQEREQARGNQVALVDIPLSASERPSRERLLQLVDLLRSCSYPMLIHCKQGADRTGLATAVYRMVRLGVPPREALGSFQLEHAHVPLFGPENLHKPLVEYDGWLVRKGLAHTPSRFRDWVATEYQGSQRLHHDRSPAGEAPDTAVAVHRGPEDAGEHRTKR